MKILILGGTEDARLFADALVGLGHDVTTSFAGRTSGPTLPKGEIRTGGFGGAKGLEDHLRREGIERLVDATHPYSVQIATNAVAAAKAAGIRLVRLKRPEWVEPSYAFWKHLPSYEEAARALPAGAHVLLTIGHRGLEHFLARKDCSFVIRSIEPPDIELPPNARSILGRPPFFVGGETELLQREVISHLVTKNSGGVQTEAKLKAAQQLGLSVLMIARPVLPEAIEAATVGRAIAALHLSSP